MTGERYHCDLAWLGGDSATAEVTLTVTDGHLTAVESGGSAPAGAVRLAGLTLPGFANAHSHAFHRALRGRTQAGRGSFWAWREQMYALADRLDPDSYFLLARATFAEMVLAGFTVVGEFHYLHHGPSGLYAEPNAMGDAVVAAAGEAGLRLTLLDACYLRGSATAELDRVQRRFSDGDVERWAARADAFTTRSAPEVRVGAAVHSVRAVAPADIGVVARWAEDRGAVLHAHVSEQPAENEACLAAEGVSPTEVFASAGALSDRFTAVHATHLTDGDVERLGSHRCTACFCPTTERDLADGIGPAGALIEAGARLALGSDSHAVIDPFEEARAVELDARLATGVRGRHDAPSLLGAATEHGHAALGWPEGGRLEVGAPADFVSVDLDSVRTAGGDATHALDVAVFAAAPADVHHVVVGGRVVVAEHCHRTLDVADELRRAVGAVVSS